MTKARTIDSRDFGKYHNMTRLESVIKDCEVCKKKRFYIYQGKSGKEHKYECLGCGDVILSNRRLR